jgi:hypothetical protein
VLKSSTTIVASRALWLLVFAAACGPPLGAQSISGPDVFADVDVTDSRNAASDTGLVIGVTVVSPPIVLGRHWDLSVTVRVSREPVVAMAREGDEIVPAYIDAWRLSASIGFAHTAHAIDLDIVGRFAETRMDDAPQLTIAENDNGPWTFLFDASTHVRGYLPRDRGLPQAQRRLAPIVEVFGGVRHDRRFHRAGDLQPYDDPTGRLFGGVVVGAWRWRRADGAPRLVVQAGGDFETALRAGMRLPSTGRIFVLAVVDLRRMTAQ